MPKKELKEQLRRGLKELGAKATKLTIAAADFIEEQAQVGKLKFDILTLKRQIERNFKDIGEEVLKISRSPKPTNPLDNENIKHYLKDIGELEERIKTKRAEIDKITEMAQQRRVERAKSFSPPTSQPSDEMMEEVEKKEEKTGKPKKITKTKSEPKPKSAD